MCQIIVAKTGNIPEIDLENSMKWNPDGWGFCFKSRTSGSMVVRKGLHAESAIERWRKDKMERQGQTTIFHARFATSGDVNIKNCHPFRTKGHDTWIAHNGTLAEHTFRKHKSDTRGFLHDILKKLDPEWHTDEWMRKMVERYLGGGRMAVMDKMGGVRILNEERWKKIENRWYSNSQQCDAWGVQQWIEPQQWTEPQRNEYQPIPLLPYRENYCTKKPECACDDCWYGNGIDDREHHAICSCYKCSKKKRKKRIKTFERR